MNKYYSINGFYTFQRYMRDISKQYTLTPKEYGETAARKKRKRRRWLL